MDIYHSANIEGIGVTFPETQTICDGMSISGHSIDDINTVNDLKNAWRWIFENIDNEMNVETLCTLNHIVGKFTVINSGRPKNYYDEPIHIPTHNGNYYPPLPNVEKITKDIEEIQKEVSVESALELFCYICKTQIFNDGNKRTATLYSNMYLLQNGLGILSIPIDKKLEFYNALASYYEDDNKKENLIEFLRDNCISTVKD